MIEEKEEPKYLKKMESSVSKSNKKTKHKHQYKDCLLQETEAKYNILCKGTYCTICGKIGDVNCSILKHDNNILEENKELDKFDVSTIWDRFVKLNE